MNDNPEVPSLIQAASEQADQTISSVPDFSRFFERSDWLSFWITTALVLTVYLYTLAPEVTLENSGMLSTAAMYGGMAHPPGFPLWTIYAWLFTKLPFSNIAWRVALSSAVAGAFACGVIALMVSRGGAMIVEGVREFKRLEPKEERLVRLVSGSVAGMAFGFNGVFWGMAIIVDTLALGNLVFSIVLCLLMRWFYRPNRKRYLYAAFFVYGLAVSAHPTLIPAALGLPFFVMFGDRELGRDLFFAAAILSAGVLMGNYMSSFPIFPDRASPIWAIYFWIGVLSAAMWIGLVFLTRSFFTKWRPAVTAGILSILGLSPYLYLPLASMTNPPSNWGYARTVEGFFHVLSRGQFERFNPTHNLGVLLEQVRLCLGVAVEDVGWIYLVAALVPFCFLRRMGALERGLMLGLVAFYLCLSVLVLILLNPPPDRQASQLIAPFFALSHLILAIWAG